MAMKKIFRTGDDERLFYVEDKEYVYYGGFAVSQRKKCVVSLHEAIQKKYPV